jgi:23S rRNA (cytidine1920-2'-O)/16S rRNA (cytidine1409-2'-O)-methyltransferase
MSVTRRRLDAALTARGFATSRAEAQRLVAERRVTVDGAPALKAASQVHSGAELGVTGSERTYASRGGDKLAGALEAVAVDPAGRRCLDVGAAHGGFTDALLQAGASSVVAVDVGYGQLDWSLRTNQRVTVLERTNARFLTAELVPAPAPSLAVADVSFISLGLVLPAMRAVATATADFLVLVKPQFEVGRDELGKHGVVREPSSWQAALESVVAHAESLGLCLQHALPSVLQGPAGNIEFFAHFSPQPRAEAAHASADGARASPVPAATQPRSDASAASLIRAAVTEAARC